MDFKHLTKAEFDELTPEKQNEYAENKRKFEAEEAEKKAKQIAEDAVKEALKDTVSKEEYTKLQDTLKKQGEELETIKENGGKKEVKKVNLFEEVKANKEAIKGLVKGTNSKEVVIKADTLRSSIANSASQMMLPSIGQLGVKVRGLYDLFKKVNFPDGDNAGKIVYHDWDEATTVRAADMVAEGTQFPESTAKFAKYEIPLRKIGDTLPVSEEFGEDEVSAAAELDSFINTNVETKIDSQLAIGDNTGQNLKGLLTSVPAYTPTPEGIPGANIYDLVKRVKTAITFNRGSKYRPDFVVFNDDVADSLHLEKDKNDNYIFPDKMNIGNITIVIDNNIPANQMVVGDSRYATIYQKEGVELSRVWVNAQAIEDMVTIKARKRMLFLIRNVDQTGFLKVTDIDAALITLSTSA